MSQVPRLGLGEKLEEEMNSRNTHGVCDLGTLMVFMKISCRLDTTHDVFVRITNTSCVVSRPLSRVPFR
jgi:hypothetical protein